MWFGWALVDHLPFAIKTVQLHFLTKLNYGEINWSSDLYESTYFLKFDVDFFAFSAIHACDCSRYNVNRFTASRRPWLDWILGHMPCRLRSSFPRLAAIAVLPRLLMGYSSILPVSAHRKNVNCNCRAIYWVAPTTSSFNRVIMEQQMINWETNLQKSVHWKCITCSASTI